MSSWSEMTVISDRNDIISVEMTVILVGDDVIFDVDKIKFYNIFCCVGSIISYEMDGNCVPYHIHEVRHT